MYSHRARLTVSGRRRLVIAGALLAVAVPSAPAAAAETGVEPLPAPVPASEPAPVPEGDEGVTSSTMRMSPNLTVLRAQIRHGRLTISAVVTSGATGTIRGRADFGHGPRRFTAHIDSRGVVRIDKRFRRARGASSARVSLVLRGTPRFLGQRLTLRVTRQSTQLRVLTPSS